MGVLGSQVHRARARHAGEPFLQHHIVPQPLEQSLEQMGMGIHHARHHNAPAAVHHFRPGVLLLQLLAAADGLNPIVFHTHAAALQDLAAFVHSDQPAISEDEAHSVVPPVDALFRS